MFEGSLYASTNDTDGDIYKIDLATGVTTFLMSVASGGEQEGCAFLQRSDGSLFHTLDFNAATVPRIRNAAGSWRGLPAGCGILSVRLRRLGWVCV